MKNIKDISQFVILYCNSNGLTINPLKLQKLLYYIQAWHIVKNEKKTLFEELPQAWVNGPVYKPVYKTYSDRFYRTDNLDYKGDNPINDELQNALKKLHLSERSSDIVFAVLKAYGVLGHDKLVQLSHQDSPWNEARVGLTLFERSTNIISADSMFNFYSKAK
jgi:uncharacterized phage-associated protein